MKEDKYSVRVSFNHGNEILLDLKGCGSNYIQPGHDYFFENAPMKFIDYLVQLRRLGITYKITQDKRGCFKTFNLAAYFSNDQYTQLEAIRNVEPVDFTLIGKKLKQATTKVEQEVVLDSTRGNYDADVVSSIKEELLPVTEEVPTEEIVSGSISQPLVMEEVKEPEVTEVPTGEVKEPEVTEVPTEEKPIDLEALNKQELINYAISKGLTHITDIYTKKEIKEELLKVL